MADSLVADMGEVMEPSVDEQHGWKCRLNFVVARFHLGDARDDVPFAVCQDQGYARDILVSFSTSLKLKLLALVWRDGLLFVRRRDIVGER